MGSNKNATFKSSVKRLVWHPNNEVVATGATDFHVFCHHRRLGHRTTASSAADTFGHLLYMRRSAGWVEAVAWSQSGNVLACRHDATIAINRRVLLSSTRYPVGPTLHQLNSGR